jgi:hypothetical protein
MWFRVRSTVRRLAFLGVMLVSALAVIPTSSTAQTRFRASSNESLAWWQLNPHLNHLWATTCMEDPAWRPGEGVSLGQAGAYVRSLQKRFGYAALLDTIVPLYPRRRVRPVCSPGVTAELTVGDTVRWQNVRGKIDIDVNSINTGLRMRDNFLHGLLESERYRNISFRIDSVVSVQPGDTIKAIAVGVLSVHGSTQPMRIPIKAFREGTGLRVVGQTMQSAMVLTEVWGLSKMKLGLGVGLNLWKEIHMGVDMVLVKAAPGTSP